MILSTSSTNGIQIPSGSSRPIDYSLNASRWMRAATSNVLTTSTTSVKTTTTWSVATIYAVEILEAGGTPPATRGRRIIIC